MPNGKPGDHPLTDVLVHRATVYSPLIDDLIRQAAALGSAADLERLASMLLGEFDNHRRPDLDELERRLRILIDERRRG